MAIKITAADKAFSDYIRARALWRCERCGSTPDRRGLHCSHYHGRGKWSVRFDPDNAESLCMGCHLHLTAHPREHHARILGVLGPDKYRELLERANDLSLGRAVKRDLRGIAKTYRQKLKGLIP